MCHKDYSGDSCELYSGSGGFGTNEIIIVVVVPVVVVILAVIIAGMPLFFIEYNGSLMLFFSEIQQIQEGQTHQRHLRSSKISY